MAQLDRRGWIGDAMHESLAPGATVLSVGEGFGELLVRLAGRLPDELLWRLRDWLEQLRDEWARTRGTELPRPGLRTAEPPEAVLQALFARGASLHNLEVVGAGLEEAFLTLTHNE